MRKKLDRGELILVGSLLFGLFFGAGNLIFPLELGQKSGFNLPAVTLGFLLSGVGLPILGVIATARANSKSLFDLGRPAGKSFAYFFTVLLYLTIGPGFAIPRTASMSYTTAFGDNPNINQSLALLIFSAIFILISLYFALQANKIIETIGKFLTPIFLVLLAILVLYGLIKPMGPAGSLPPVDRYISSPFTEGVIDGYNTLDAPASLAFAVIIISAIQNLGIKDPSNIAKETAKAGLICLIAMSLVYVSLAYLGSASANLMDPGDNGAIILGFISKHYTGAFGHILLSAIVTVACIKTSIGLISACADVFAEMFDKLSYKHYCYIFAGLSFLVANLGLSKIISLSIPVLMFIYPLSIVLIFLALANKYIKKSPRIYKWTLTFTAVPAIFDFLKATPEFISKNPSIMRIIDLPAGILPGYDLGFCWIIPAIIGFIIGLTIDKSKNQSKVNKDKKVYEAGK